MNISFNGDSVVIDVDLTLVAMLEKQQLADKKGIAVAVNEDVVSRNEWDKYVLKDNDKILVIKATQGG